MELHSGCPEEHLERIHFLTELPKKNTLFSDFEQKKLPSGFAKSAFQVSRALFRAKKFPISSIFSHFSVFMPNFVGCSVKTAVYLPEEHSERIFFDNFAVDAARISKSPEKTFTH